VSEQPKIRKKLIEVALPLEAINKEAAHEKSVPRKGHPATMHLWWARRPLATCRAVLFASLVDDPSSHPEQFPTEEAQDKERERLFTIIEDLVKWENSNDETVLNAARKEILKSTNGHPPPVLDPFCGGGTIPLEAQRLGLEAHASDLNPVAVLITKALIEIPPKFAGKPPVNPEARKKLDHSKTWHGAQGLAEDVRYYGEWMRDEAEKRIGYLYPKVKLPKQQGGSEATVIAWLWARTVKCPNPACGAQMPLVRSFWLSTKAGKNAWVEPVVDRRNKTLRFEVNAGNGGAPNGTVNRRGATCVVCGTPVPFDHIRSEGNARRMRARLMAVVAEGGRGRTYLPSDPEQEEVATSAVPEDPPDTNLPEQALGFRVQRYGMTKHRDLFTARQLVAMTTFSNLVSEVRDRVVADARNVALSEQRKSINDGLTGTTAYADAVATYVAFAIDKLADWSSTICSWIHSIEGVRDTFPRQAIPMVWDFVEINPFSNSVGNYWNHLQWVADGLGGVPPTAHIGTVRQLDAASLVTNTAGPVVFTDPPYYDNIAYADLSDFFYVWLRRSLNKVYPDLFSTLLTPKAQELVATPFRFEGNEEKAERFFEDGLAKAFGRMREAQHPDFPLTLYYAFKQAESEDNKVDEGSQSLVPISTGWETMLEGLLKARFIISGTWPMRTERSARTRGVDSNALASSIVVVCRPRSGDAALATRREFLNALKMELPVALKNLQRGNIAPVDLAQAAIGPGMAVFSRYSKVVEADGSPMTVRTALALINQTLDEVLAEQEGEFDADTRFAVAWFEQYGFKEGPFGEADVLARAKNTAVNGLTDAGIAKAKAGKVRLLGREDLAEDWDPASERRLTIWEVAHYLIRLLEDEGESAASLLLRQVGALGETARDLAYRLYGICERKKWAQEALPYNSLVVAWPEIVRLSRSTRPAETQARLGI
jgi:putative DNA methylase